MTETLMQGSGIVRTFSGLAPSFRADGSMLEVGAIAGYKVNIARSGNGPSAILPSVSTTLVGGVFDYVLDVDAVGIHTYTISFSAIDTEGRESVPSAAIVVTVIAQVISAPNPPVVS